MHARALVGRVMTALWVPTVCWHASVRLRVCSCGASFQIEIPTRQESLMKLLYPASIIGLWVANYYIFMK
ncbi:hypothetical protein EON66_02945 [archaeon]|nr:MAG: hypothetical protein EON66_02945 [archaeon]